MAADHAPEAHRWNDFPSDAQLHWPSSEQGDPAAPEVGAEPLVGGLLVVGWGAAVGVAGAAAEVGASGAGEGCCCAWLEVAAGAWLLAVTLMRVVGCTGWVMKTPPGTVGAAVAAG